MSKCYVIAEIGINHNGSLDLAKAMMDVAKACGADAVKFQKRSVEDVYSEEELDRPRKSPFGETNGDLKRGLEFGLLDYGRLSDYAREICLDWGVSVWDATSARDMAHMRPSFIKVASPTLTDTGVLEAVREAKECGLKVMLSTGMSTMLEIRKAVDALGPGCLMLMHCVSAYPVDPEDAQMRMIDRLGYEFPQCLIGYSGHMSGIEDAVMAVSMGAVAVEKHFTLSRDLWGSDQKMSIEPHEFKAMVERIKRTEAMMGEFKDRECLECEEPARAKLRRA